MAGSALGAFVVALALLLRASSSETGSPGDCRLDPWVSEQAAPGEEGYHVLCFANASFARVYAGAVGGAAALELRLEGDDESGEGLRARLAELLQIRSKIAYHAQGKVLEWKKQPWTLFTTQGAELRPGTEAKVLAKQFAKSAKPKVLLLFEGGVWRWPTKRVGFRRKVLPGVWIRTVARQPALFEVTIEGGSGAEGGEESLSPALLSDVVKVAEGRLVPSSTEGKVETKIRSSEQTFLPYSYDPKLKTLEAATAKLLRGHTDTLEALQVLRYRENQHYDAHRDYWDPREFPDVPRFTNREGFWHQRHATLLWYLAAPEAGGETWFPRAHGGPIPYNEWMACDARGAKVSPANATAVLFYSLRADGEIDEYSWHSGCPVTSGVKWAANSWMSNTPRGIRPVERQPVRGAASALEL